MQRNVGCGTWPAVSSWATRAGKEATVTVVGTAQQGPVPRKEGVKVLLVECTGVLVWDGIREPGGCPGLTGCLGEGTKEVKRSMWIRVE